MQSRCDIGDLKRRLVQSIEPLVTLTLLPGGYRAGAYWIARNPSRKDENPGSFWVAMRGTPGAWRDEATGQKGDILQLIMLCHGYEKLGDAIKWAQAWLGQAPLPPRGAAPQIERSDDAARAKAERDRKTAFGIYVAARKAAFQGSPADVYLRTRGVDVRRLERHPGCLGWLEMRHAESGRVLPVMVAGMTGASGRMQAVHRTWLAADGRGKADVRPVRKIWPSFKGAAIRLWRGDSGLSVDQAAAHGLRETLVLCEGVEDGLSLALAMPEFRIWAVGTLGNIAAQELPECVDEVIVCADNDWGKPQAARQFQKGVEALARQGRKVRIGRSMIGKDANDALRGSGL